MSQREEVTERVSLTHSIALKSGYDIGAMKLELVASIQYRCSFFVDHTACPYDSGVNVRDRLIAV